MVLENKLLLKPSTVLVEGFDTELHKMEAHIKRKEPPLLITPRGHVEVKRVLAGNVVIFRNGATTEVMRVLTLSSDAIDDVPVRTGDIVMLSFQRGGKDNGRYFAFQEIEGGGIRLCSHWVFDLTRRNHTMLGLDIFMDSSKSTIRVTGLKHEVKWYPNAPALFIMPNSVVIVARHVKGRNIGLFNVLTILPMDSAKNNDALDEHRRFHPNASCSLDATAATREICQRIKGAVWDTPCVRDEDCPMFDYQTDRGGCSQDSGVCEMPIGAVRIGYKGYTGNVLIGGADSKPVFQSV
jgi:hypothetical protein